MGLTFNIRLFSPERPGGAGAATLCAKTGEAAGAPQRVALRGKTNPGSSSARRVLTYGILDLVNRLLRAVLHFPDRLIDPPLALQLLIAAQNPGSFLHAALR